MKKLIIWALASMIVIGISNEKAYANHHVMGSDLTFSCIGSDSFIVELTLFTDCSSTLNVGSSANVNASSGCNSFNLTLNRVSVKDVTPVCETSCTQCEIGCTDFNHGIEKNIYTALLVLPQNNCCEFKIVWTGSGRNATTMLYSQAFYTEAKFDRCIMPCVSSPKFTEDPVTIICRGQDFIFNQGLILPNGDSIVYLLTEPLTTNAQPILYDSIYTFDEPINYLGKGTVGKDGPFPFGFHLDTITGNLMFRPTEVQTGVLTILVQMFRNDTTIISETRREFKLIIIDCPDNKSPTIDPPFSFQACADVEIVIPITIWDPDSTGPEPDSVFLEWNHSISDATFNVDPAPIRTTGYFRWTPSQNDISSQVHRFMAIGHDNGCPVKAKTARTFAINVNPNINISIPEIISPDTICQLDTTVFYIKNYNSNLKYNWICSGSANCINNFDSILQVSFTLADSAFIEVVVSDPYGCGISQSYIKNVFISPIPENPVITGPSEICEGDSALFSIDNYDPNFEYVWNCSGSASCNLNSDSISWISFTSTETPYIEVRVTSPKGCITRNFTTNIRINPLPEVPVIKGPSEICINDSSLFIIDNYNPEFDYYWICSSSAECNNAEGNQAWINFPGLDSAYVEVIVSSAFACGTENFIKNINVISLPDTPVIIGQKEVCMGESLIYSIDNYDPSFEYSWNCFGSAECTNAEGNQALVSFNSIDSAFIEVTVNSNELCLSKYIKYVSVDPLTDIPVINGPDNVCVNYSSIYTIDNYDPLLDYEWVCSGSANCDNEFGSSVRVSFSSLDNGYVEARVSSPFGCGEDKTTTKTIYPFTLADKPQISGPEEVYNETLRVYEVTNSQQNTNYIWNCTGAAECEGETGTLADIKFISIGNSIIEVTAENNCGKVIASKSVFVEAYKSIESIPSISSVKIYPNPADGSFTLRLNTETVKNLKLEIYNDLGQIVYQEEYNELKGETELPVSLKGHAAGSYYLKLITDEGEMLRKLVVK